jgi:Cysteine-rich secretory protein family
VRIVFAFLPVLTFAFVGAAAAPAATVTSRDTLEAALVTRVNAVRSARGLPRLRVVSRLSKAAERHAGSMAGVSYFRHDLYTPTRRHVWTPFGSWIRWFYPGPGYLSWRAGENMAWGAPPPHRAQDGLPLARQSRPSRQPAGARLAQPRRGGGARTQPGGHFRAWNDVTIVVAEFGRRS